MVKKSKLLGIILSDNLKWDEHVEYICKKARKRIWMLRRMMEFGLKYETILDFYFKEITSILEYCAVVFNSGLTKKLSDVREGVQKIVLRLLSSYIGVKFTYNEACIFFSVEALSSRRRDMSCTWIKRTLANPKHREMFTMAQNTHDTRNSKVTLKE